MARIYYGTRGKVHEDNNFKSDPCDNCGSSSFTLLTVLKYFHIYWIPFFSLGRKHTLICTKCGKNINKFDADTKRDIKNSEKQPKISIFHFSGIFLVIAGIIASIISSNIDQKNTAEYVKSLQPNDYIVFDIGKMYGEEAVENNYKYGIIKISDLKKDQYGCRIPNFTFKRVSSALKYIRKNKIKESDYMDKFYMNKEHIKYYYDNGSILKVYRK